MDTPLAKLRSVEVFPVEIENRKLVCLHDPLRYAPAPLLVPYPAYFILTQLDGRRSAREILRTFARQYGTELDGSELDELLATLDAGHFLDSPRFAAHQSAIDETFRAAAVRPAAHAGVSYSDDPAALRATLDGFFSDVATVPQPAPLAGLVAPHIDLRVGGRAYGHAYAALAAAPPAERYVILGTAHNGGTTRFAATRKDFATPLGTVATDRAFLDRLAARVPEDLYRDEILHRTEHSIEFQVVLLQHALRAHDPFRIVPILVTSFHDLIAAQTAPENDPRFAGFVAALRATLAEDGVPTVVVAGVDFAHVGAKFGDRDGLTADLVARTVAKDRRLIGALAAADPGGFFRELAADADRTRVCGASPLLTFLALLPGVGGRLLDYDTSRDDGTGSAVTFASLAFG